MTAEELELRSARRLLNKWRLATRDGYCGPILGHECKKIEELLQREIDACELRRPQVEAAEPYWNR